MYNQNVRKRPKKPKESAFEKQEKKIAIALSQIEASGTISESTIRHTLKLSYTMHYQLISDLIHNHQDVVSWNKKTRMFTQIGKITSPSVEQGVKNE